MFNGLLKSLYENQVLIVNEFLQSLGAKVTLATIDDTLHEHPDYPSFLSITDSLEKWNIECLAIQTSVDKLHEIPVPFITSFKQGYFIAVAKIDKGEVTIIDENGYKKVLDKDWFLKQWTETIVVAEANEKSREPDYKKKLNQSILKSIAYTLVPVTFLVAILWPLINGTVGVVPTTYLLVKLVGLTVSLLLLWYDIDKGNPFLKQICSGIQKANCNAVLNTEVASLFGILTWSEVGFIYFAGGLLFVAFVGIKETMPLISSLSLLAFPYTIFSIYYQWKVIKQWCVLCLVVQAVLLFETTMVLTTTRISIKNVFIVFANQYLIAGVSIAIPVVSWFLLKPLLKLVNTSKYEKRSYLQLKFNDKVFWSLLKKQKSILQHNTEGLGITIGNHHAENIIVNVCNPYCGPCASMHPELEKVITQNPNIKAQIIFSVTTNETDRKNKPVKHFLAIAEKGDAQQTHKALDDWYLTPNKDYDLFASKYPMNDELKRQTEKIEKMSDWCNKVGIQYTPTLFINGYELPKNYQIRDINYFLHVEV
jgi:uncharacterized membrane protein/thiol-disulfide isomerase/thioredoxin